MGAIFGIAFHRDHAAISRETIAGVLRSLFRQSEIKGRYTGGIAIIREKNILIHKDNVPAREYPDTQGYRAIINKGTTRDKTNPIISIVGSIREAVTGESGYIRNSQPMSIGEKIIGVCNGNVFNHRQIMADMMKTYAEEGKASLFKRYSSTDVEALFQLMYYYGHITHVDGHGHLTSVQFDFKQAVQDACNCARGGFAGAMIPANNPYLLFLFRTLNPLRVLIFDKPGVTIFCSFEYAIHLAVQGRGWSDPAPMSFSRFSGIGINLYNNKFNLFEIVPEMNDAIMSGGLL